MLLDPYPKALDGAEQWARGCFAYPVGNPAGDFQPIDSDQLGAPRGVVIDPEFDWEDDVSPATPLHRSVVYETHVRGRDARTLLGNYTDGHITLYVIHVALTARRRAPELFRWGNYEALLGGKHVVAFTRAAGRSA